MEFEWNENKNQANIVKHGIDFDEAKHIFDGFVLSGVDAREDYGEVRLTAIGIAEGRELFVVYTIRGNAIRLISARRANTHERRTYREAQTD